MAGSALSPTVLLFLAVFLLVSYYGMHIGVEGASPPIPRRWPPPRRQPPPPRRSPRPPPLRKPPPPFPPPSPRPSPPPPSPVTYTRAKNGIRLVGDSGPRGRLEISSKAAWLTGYQSGAVAWRPVCDGFFDDHMAGVMCKLLGYSYGRTYYTAEVAFRPPNASAAWNESPVDYVYCYATHDDNAPPPSEFDQQGSSHGRRLLAPLRGDVDIPKHAPYTCSFRKGECGYSGPLVGIECSRNALPPSSPPPPLPPNPPGRPPSYETLIKGIGGNYGNMESNLCQQYPQPFLCSYLLRAELLVPEPAGGQQVWAPLCASTNGSLNAAVAQLACGQFVDWPYGGYVDYISSDVFSPFSVPTTEPEQGAADVFRPSSYSYWVTIVGGNAAGKLALQQMEYKVEPSACEYGMLAFFCRFVE